MQLHAMASFPHHWRRWDFWATSAVPPESTTRVNPTFTKPSPQKRAQLLLTNLFGIEISVLTQQNLELPLKPWDTQICLACLASTAENSHEAKKKPSRSLSVGNSDRIPSTDLVGNTVGFLLILPLNPAIETSAPGAAPSPQPPQYPRVHPADPDT